MGNIRIHHPQRTIPGVSALFDYHCSPGTPLNNNSVPWRITQRIIRGQKSRGGSRNNPSSACSPKSNDMKPFEHLQFPRETEFVQYETTSQYLKIAGVTSECLVPDTSEYLSASCQVNVSPRIGSFEG
ncbi:hypothetical protein TNCV_3836901 [Trichonephila clavipes]|nr:hypothetical protein TNCV_3836901 [Trichonephila clavipes]